MELNCGPQTSLSSFSTLLPKFPFPHHPISFSFLLQKSPPLPSQFDQDITYMDAADDDLDLEEEYMKEKKVIKREATKHQAAADDHMEDDDLFSATAALDDDKKKKATAANVGGSGIRKGPSTGAGGGSGASSMKCCQAEKCTADLTDAKQYHRRHKVCEHHAKAQVVMVGGIRQRFCQQCSRFHELSEFDEAKRSCRRRLAGHNERRRKNSAETQAEGSGRKGSPGTQMNDLVCGQVDDRGRIQISIQENATYKHFQIR